MVAVDYAEHFWGEKHHGYQILYENLKRGEDAVQELTQILKDRTSFEEECTKFFSKSVNKSASLSSSGGAFTDTWAVTKGTLERLAEVQSSFLFKMQQLLKDVVRYHEDLVRSRKRVKEQDVIDAVNLMQTTTTCLQKSKETYMQRCSELEKLRKENGLTKEITKAESKVLKSREEYKNYVEKYGRARTEFEEKMVKAAHAFQAHDHAFLQQMKTFFVSFAVALDDASNASTKIYSQYRDAMDKIDIDAIMLKFIETKGTGSDRPEMALFEELDGLGDGVVSGSLSAPSSSNSSAIIHPLTQPESVPPTAHDLLALDSGNFESWNEDKTGQSSPSVAENTVSTNSSIFSASLGRQKLSMWLPSKRKKHSSQGSLPVGDNGHQEHSQFESSGFLKKYRNKAKKSLVDLTPAATDVIPGVEDSRSTASSSKSDEKTYLNANGYLNALDLPLAPPPPLPTHPPPEETDEEGYTVRERPIISAEHSICSSCSESSDEDEEMSRAAKLRQINIKPLSESVANVTSMDELRLAAENISMNNASINRSSTFDADPWTATTRTTPFSLSFGGNVRPLRAAYTGDDYLRKKHSGYFTFNETNTPLPFSLSMGGSSMARARPRSNTPTFNASCMTLNSTIMSNNGLSSNARTDVSANNIPAFLRSDSTNSLGLCPDSPFSASTSNLFTVASNAGEHKLPVAMAVNEYVHAWFKGTEASQYSVRVFGTVLVSFPSSAVPVLTDVMSNVEPLKFRLVSLVKLKTILPNKQLVSLPSGDNSTPYLCAFDRNLLATWLNTQTREKPNAPFYNAEVLRYELLDAVAPPLSLATYWKLDKENTDIRIDYNLNTDSPMQNALLNLSFSTKVDGGVLNITADPKEEWSSATNTLSWKLTELSRHGDGGGSLKARLTLRSGPSTASQTFIQFQTSDATISGTTVTIENEDAYFLSLLRRKVLSGKYYCDPEVFK